MRSRSGLSLRRQAWGSGSPAPASATPKSLFLLSNSSFARGLKNPDVGSSSVVLRTSNSKLLQQPVRSLLPTVRGRQVMIGGAKSSSSSPVMNNTSNRGGSILTMRTTDSLPRGYATETNVKWVRRELDLLEDAYRAGVKVPRERVVQAVKLSARTQDTGLVAQMTELSKRLLPSDRRVRNTVAGAQAQFGAGDLVLRTMEEMEASGIKGLKPNTVTWNALIAAYANAGERGKALTAFDHMQEAGFRPDRVTFNTLIKAHVAEGDIEAALSTFEYMKARAIQPDDRTYSVLINGYLKQGLNDEAKNLLLDMEGRRITPSLMTLTSFIYANSKANALDAAQRILERLSEEGLQANRVTYTAIIEGMARNGLGQQALLVFKDMVDEQGIEPDALTYSSLLKAVANQPDRAWSLYEDMQNRGVIPDHIFMRDLIRTQMHSSSSADDARINDLAEKTVDVGLRVTPTLNAAASHKLLEVLVPRPHAAVRAWRRMMQMRSKLPSLSQETFDLARSLIDQVDDHEARAEMDSVAAELSSSARSVRP